MRTVLKSGPFGAAIMGPAPEVLNALSASPLKSESPRRALARWLRCAQRLIGITAEIGAFEYQICALNTFRCSTPYRHHR